ncbi:MAG: type II secretion system F family protein [Vibrio sp.]|uniref:type II secretion system F family protein n=1 Tax=Vibrio sp. TaxID=678 RepID=UPI003A870889
MDPIIIILVASIIALIVAMVSNFILDNIRNDLLISNYVGYNKKNSVFISSLKKAISLFKYNKEETKGKLITAGIHSDIIANGYYLFKVIPFVLSTIVLSYLLYSEVISTLMFSLLFFAVIMCFIILPDMYISYRGKSNISRMNQRLPFLLDLMSICINTGMTTEATLAYLAKEISLIDKELAYVIQRTVDRTDIVGIHKALGEFQIMIPTSEAKSFVTTILNNVRFGSSIGAVLLTLSSDIREINMLELEEKIGKMSAKMSIPMIVFIMIPIVVLIVAPGIMRIFMS